MKKLYILFLTIILTFTFSASAFATVDPNAGFSPGVIYTLPSNTTSPAFTNYKGSFIINLSEMDSSNNVYSILYPTDFGSLTVDRLWNGNNYDYTLSYVLGSVKTPLFTKNTSSIFSNIIIEVFVLNGVEVVSITGSDFAKIKVIDNASYTGVNMHGVVSNNLTIAPAPTITYQYNPSGLPPAPTGTVCTFTIPNADVTESLKTYTFSTYASIPIAHVGDTVDMFSTSVTNASNIIMLQSSKVIKIDGHGQPWVELFSTFTATMAVGANAVTYHVNYSGFDYTAVRNYTVVEGVVDANNDGIDDRTGKPNALAPPPPNSTTSLNMPLRSDYEATIFGSINFAIDTIIAYIKAPFVFIGNTLTVMLDWLTSSTLWIAAITTFFGAIFGFLPAPILGALIMIFSVIAIFTIIRIIRG